MAKRHDVLFSWRKQLEEKSHLTVKGWGSKRSQSRKMTVAGFWNHVALAHCRESFASGVRVDDQLCNLITTKDVTNAWDVRFRYSAPSRGLN